jgi:hypothetical protein
MKVLICFFTLVFFISCSNSTKKVKRSVVKAPQVPVSVKLYEGPELPQEKIVRIVSEQTDSRFMYFISVNGKKINSRSLMNGPREVLLRPGSHSIQMRFIAKGKLAIPLKPFNEVNFEKGKTYVVKSNFIFGTSDYISSAKNTKITVWIEEVGKPKKIGLMTLDGFGR